MTPLEEQIEKLTRYRVTQDVDGGWSEPKEMVVLDDLRALLPLEVTDEGPLRVTVDTADLIELLYGATTDSPANRKARTRLSAALTQPQAEQWHENDEADKAATAAGVADADLELPLTDSTLVEEVVAAVYEACLDRAMDDPDAIEVAAVLRGELTGTRAATEPGPYAKAFRERVCPVPEFPSVGTAPQEAQADPKKDVCPNCGEVANGCNYCRKTPAPVPQTEGECPDCEATLKPGGECPNCIHGIPCSGTGKEGEK